MELKSGLCEHCPERHYFSCMLSYFKRKVEYKFFSKVVKSWTMGKVLPKNVWKNVDVFRWTWFQTLTMPVFPFPLKFPLWFFQNWTIIHFLSTITLFHLFRRNFTLKSLMKTCWSFVVNFKAILYFTVFQIQFNSLIILILNLLNVLNGNNQSSISGPVYYYFRDIKIKMWSGSVNSIDCLFIKHL